MAGNARRPDRLIPFTLFTDPELARVDLTEKEAREQGFELRIAKLSAATIPRVKTMNETRGFMKAVIDAKTIVSLVAPSPQLNRARCWAQAKRR